MSDRGYALHSVCPQLFFLSFTPSRASLTHSSGTSFAIEFIEATIECILVVTNAFYFISMVTSNGTRHRRVRNGARGREISAT